MRVQRKLEAGMREVAIIATWWCNHTGCHRGPKVKSIYTNSSCLFEMKTHSVDAARWVLDRQQVSEHCHNKLLDTSYSVKVILWPKPASVMGICNVTQITWSQSIKINLKHVVIIVWKQILALRWQPLVRGSLCVPRECRSNTPQGGHYWRGELHTLLVQWCWYSRG